MVHNGIITAILILIFSQGLDAQIQGSMRRDAAGGAPPTSNNLLTNLVSCWEMNDASGTTASDEESLNDLTFQGTPAWLTSANCISGGCLSFDGVSDGLKIQSGTNDYNFRADLTDYSVNFWYKGDDPTGTQGTVWLWRNWDGSGDYAIRFVVFSDDRIDWVARSGSSLKQVIVNSATHGLFDGNWHMITGTWDDSASEMELYVDGSSVGSATTSNSTHAVSVEPFDFFYDRHNNEYIDADADQLAIWDKELTATDISNLYNSGSGLPYSNWD